MSCKGNSTAENNAEHLFYFLQNIYIKDSNSYMDRHNSKADFKGSKRCFSLEQYKTLVSAVVGSHNGEESVALDLHSHVELSLAHMGVIGMAICCATDLHEAFDIWTRFYKTHSNLFDYSMRLEGSHVHLAIEAAWDFKELDLVSTTLAVCMLYKIKTQLLKRPSNAADRITFSCPKPEHISQYIRAFDCPIEFDAAKTEIIFPESDLAVPLSCANKTSCGIFIKELMKIQKQLEAEDEANLINQIKTLIHENINGPFSAEDVADTMLISTRTLRRRLSQFGTSFKEMVIQQRIDMAKNLLKTTTWTMREIARDIGFCDAAHFAKTFKQVCGQSPVQYRASLYAKAAS